MPNYKVGVPIIVSYQAVNSETGLTIEMKVYNEGYTLESTEDMTELVATGRYYKAFTPDAAGEWIVTMAKKTTGGGEVIKAFRVAAGDEFGIKAAVDALENISTAEVAAELATYDGPTMAEMDAGHALLATPAQVATALDTYDAPTKAELDVLGTGALATAAALTTVDNELATVDGVVDDILIDTAAIDTATSATGGIRGADSDSLKTLSDQLDAYASPAMVG